jgi:hypothetical protein
LIIDASNDECLEQAEKTLSFLLEKRVIRELTKAENPENEAGSR